MAREYRSRPKRSLRDRALAQLRGYWEPQDTSSFEQSMSSAVEKTMKGLGLENRFHEDQVFEAWNDLVSDSVASHAHPVALQRKALIIQVLHSGMHYELERMKGQILQKMQDRFGSENIREVRFRLG
ncbi:MAG: DUF721 domain-containing protein [Verrucomicrobiota bacterium]